MTAPGRQFVEAPPETWLDVHLRRRPSDLEPYEAALGRLLRRVLRGDHVVDVAPTRHAEDGPQRVSLAGVTDDDRRAFARLAVPEGVEGRPAAGSLDLTAILLPELVQVEPRWTMARGSMRGYVDLSSTDAIVCQRLLAPVLSELALVLRLRAGEGPKKDRGRAERLARCRSAHQALGLDSAPIDALLDPDLEAQAVVEARMALAGSWAGAGDDIGERAIALLCARLATAYYGKARKDGRIEAARVLTQTTAPLLEATLGDWPRLLAYLGEEPADADATPVALPDLVLPAEPPTAVVARLKVLQEWWEMYDALHATVEAGDRSLVDLVPSRWDYRPPGDAGEPLAQAALGEDLAARIDDLWGWQVLDRHPTTLVRTPRPLSVLAELLEPAARFWDDLSLSAWYLCFGPYSRRTLDELEEHQRSLRKELHELGAPVDESLYAQLVRAGAAHPWLFEQAGIGISLSLSFDEDDGEFQIDEEQRGGGHPEGPDVFLSLRDVITSHRRRWIGDSLAPYLDALWRRDLAAAATAYWKRYRGRGKPPTIKQALPDVGDAARRWFGSDYGELARLLGLDGPVSDSPVRSPRTLPDDLLALQNEVVDALRLRVRATDDRQRREWDLRRLSTVATNALVHWQATGETPTRANVMPASYREVVEHLFDCELDVAYSYVLEATTAVLDRRGHPAATDLTP